MKMTRSPQKKEDHPSRKAFAKVDDFTKDETWPKVLAFSAYDSNKISNPASGVGRPNR